MRAAARRPFFMLHRLRAHAADFRGFSAIAAVYMKHEMQQSRVPAARPAQRRMPSIAARGDGSDAARPRTTPRRWERQQTRPETGHAAHADFDAEERRRRAAGSA